MNVHHLELFYYVASHGGISAAVRHIPYGIQQPAVSGQMSRLEKDLGVKLFERQPFRLTPEGKQLREFVEPFFGNLDRLVRRLREGALPQLRMGASEVVLRSHLPVVLERLRRQHGEVRLGLRSGFDTELMEWLRQGEVDMIVTPFTGRLPPRTRSMQLVQLPLVLLVPKRWKLTSAEQLLNKKRVTERLISLPPRETLTVVFQRGLRKRGIEWPVAVEASSTELITKYVADGRGAGVSMMLPELINDRRVQVLPLAGFEMLNIVALWHGELSAFVQALLHEAQRYTGELWPGGIANGPVQVNADADETNGRATPNRLKRPRSFPHRVAAVARPTDSP